MTTQRERDLADSARALATPKPTPQLPPVEPSEAAKERMIAKAQGTPTTVGVIEGLFLRKGVQAALGDVMPKHLDLNRMRRIAISALRKNQALQVCDPMSFLNAVMQSAALGLEPNTPLGLSYLVPFKRECTLIVGYKGMTKLAYQTGLIGGIIAHLVYEAEEAKGDFKVCYGTNERIEHSPILRPEDRGEVIGGYAIVPILAGGQILRFMPIQEIDAAKPAHTTSGPWFTHIEEMRTKTLLRRVVKLAPMSPELNAAVVADEAAERGEAPDLLNIPDAGADDDPDGTGDE